MVLLKKLWYMYYGKNYGTIPKTMELWLTMEKTMVLWEKNYMYSSIVYYSIVYYNIFLLGFFRRWWFVRWGIYLPKSDILSAINQSFLDFYEEYLWNEKAFLLHINVCRILQNQVLAHVLQRTWSIFWFLKILY